MRRVDAHHHLWRTSIRRHEWLDGPEITAIRRDFTTADLRAAAVDVAATVLVQVRPHLGAGPQCPTQEGGYRGTQQLLARPHPPTAIFAGADIVAMGVLTALGPIALTNVDKPATKSARKPPALLLKRITDRNRPTAQIKLSPTLVTRPRRPGHTAVMSACSAPQDSPVAT